MKESISSFRIGAGENDIVCVEDLLMKLAMAETVIKDMTRYINAVEENDGVRPDNIEEPERWAVSGVWQNLAAVNHALKCGCWGHNTASFH